VHEDIGTHSDGLQALKLARALGLWFHRTFGRDPEYKAGPFIPPTSPHDPTADLIAEMDRLRSKLDATLTASQHTELRAAEAEAARVSAEERAAAEARDRRFWEDYAAEAEAKASMNLVFLQTQALQLNPSQRNERRLAIENAAKGIVLDESETRALVDGQLRDRGWEADTLRIRYSAGVRPAKGRNLAIAEWPTENGPADYALFVGTTCVGVIEAKRKRKNVSAAVDQAGRYSLGLRPEAGIDFVAGSPWAAESNEDYQLRYRVPFLFATNARPYLKQIETESGIWFRDVRLATNLRRPLTDWPTPQGLEQVIGTDRAKAHGELEAMPFDFGFQLRDYQERAIRAVEDVVSDDAARAALIAMATGTGKTKLAIAMLYRLLASKRFRRICFVVDRRALGEQAEGEFSTTRIVGARTFADIFGLKGLDETDIDPSTKVHICTIQGLVKRVLFEGDPKDVPPVDQYDLMVVDECHRGYLLDREMSETELAFRDEADYVSKYRRVLEHFDAVKVGLTATPALHTTEIFGDPIFTYSYREAVVDGWLADSEPPIRIRTALSADGIHFKRGEELHLFDPKTGDLDLTHAPDDLDFDIAEFNKRVVTREFNRVVAEELAKHIDPSLPGKTLVFAATDGHADILVDELKKAFEALYGSIDDATVKKITGSIDAPGKAIKRFRNDANPSVAVTVDLLTTGVDIPSITNLVFVRRVSSRILYEQMLGRATRKCDEIGKETFRIFDAVGIYDALKSFTTMKPVVVNPSIAFEVLFRELTDVSDERHRALVRDQIVVKLRSRIQRLHRKAAEQYEALAGETPQDTLKRIADATPQDFATWIRARAGLGKILDWEPEGVGGATSPLVISTHPDLHRSTTVGYGGTERPEDYLEAFTRFVRENENEIAALRVVTQRPRELSRESLKELAMALDANGFPEATIRAAFRDARNEDIAASLVGFVRQAALGDALEPWENRVHRAVARILRRQAWTQPQRQWLERIGRRVAEMGVADRSTLDEEQFKVAGGFTRLNRIFDGKLETILADINDEAWKEAG
jgi:type I restriction enzyme R subunit